MTGKARYLKELFYNNKINEKTLENAVTKGWITSDEKIQIIENN